MGWIEELLFAVAAGNDPAPADLKKPLHLRLVARASMEFFRGQCRLPQQINQALGSFASLSTSPS